MRFATELEREDFVDGLDDVRRQLAELTYCYVAATEKKAERIFKRRSVNRSALKASALGMELLRGLEEQARRAEVERPPPLCVEGPVTS
jgi:hypothetical protein